MNLIIASQNGGNFIADLANLEEKLLEIIPKELSRGKSFSQMSPAIPAARSQKSPAGCGKTVENCWPAVNCSSV